jgi:outer membrane receptor protein involved in Fe transport
MYLRKMVIKTAIILIVLLQFGELKAQSEYKISGFLNNESALPVEFATVAFYNQQDSALITGTITDADGKFEIIHYMPGDYLLAVSFIGYKPLSKKIEVQEPNSMHVGILVLQQNTIKLAEAKVVSERIKARQDVDKTTFYVNKKMQKASNTGIDMVKLVPGIQVDLLQVISLEGKQNVLVMINGIERNASFLNQLSSDKIDKIEINTNPGTKYSSEISGVINVILKKDKSDGVSGHVYAEIPVNSNEIYSFPSVSINYNFKKLNIFSSYNGEFSYFDIDAHNKRSILVPNHQFEINKKQSIHQKSWSHKFNLGFDYFLDDKNHLNFYGFINPYSNEHDGTVTINKTVGNTSINSVEYNRDDEDKNRSVFASVYYKHLFKKPDKQLDFEMSYYNFKAENSTFLLDNNSSGILTNTVQPTNDMFNACLDFSLPLKPGLKLETGIKESVQILGDEELSSFNYREVVSAAYASLFFTKSKFQLNGGIRVEYANIYLAENLNNQILSVLPNLTAKYDLSEKSSIKFAYRKSLARPHVYQLNPNLNYIDPYTTQQGNPLLDPVVLRELSLDYSILVNNNFISVGTFYSLSSDITENMTLLNDSLLFETSIQNSGNISRFGFKILGSLKPHKNITFNPFLKVFDVQTQGNKLAKANKIEDKSMMAMESGLSMAVLFKHDIALSFMYKYYSANAKIQNKYFDDVLYFISLEKTFFQNLKFGITSAIPFKKSFTYQGHESENHDFNVYSKDKIKMSAFPVWLKIKYSFTSGKKVNRISRRSEFKENKIKKGF